MSYAEPDASGYTPHPSEIDPTKFAVCPSDENQEIVFQSIQAISSGALQPSGTVPARRTARGVRPLVRVEYNESRSAVVFSVTLPTEQTVQCHVPHDSWRYSTCSPENVRAAVQKAYLNLLQGKDDPIIVRPTMLSLRLVAPNRPSHSRSQSHGSKFTTTAYYTPQALRHSHQSYSSSDSNPRHYSLVAGYSAPTTPIGSSTPPMYYDPYRGGYAVAYVPAGNIQYSVGGRTMDVEKGVVPPMRAPAKLSKRKGLW